MPEIEKQLEVLKKNKGMFVASREYTAVIQAVEEYRDAVSKGKSSKADPKYAEKVAYMINEYNKNITNESSKEQIDAVYGLNKYMEKVGDDFPETAIRAMQGRARTKNPLTDEQINNLRKLFEKINAYDERVEVRKQMVVFRDLPIFSEEYVNQLNEISVDMESFNKLKDFFKLERDRNVLQEKFAENSDWELLASSDDDLYKSVLGAMDVDQKKYEALIKCVPFIDAALEKEGADFGRVHFGELEQQEEVNFQEQFGEFVEGEEELLRIQSISEILQNLRKAKTFTNSNQYKNLLTSVEKLEKNLSAGKGLDPALTEKVLDDMQAYFEHKARRGVKENAGDKLVAVEELYQFMGELLKKNPNLEMKEIGIKIPELTEEETSTLTIKDRPITTKKNKDLDAAYKRIRVASEIGISEGRITEAQYNEAKISIDAQHNKLIANAKAMHEEEAKEQLDLMEEANQANNQVRERISIKDIENMEGIKNVGVNVPARSNTLDKSSENKIDRTAGFNGL